MSKNIDTEFRRFRFVEMRPGEGFWDAVDGWIALAEAHAPRSPKSLLEEFGIAELPDGTVLREVSYKTEHSALGAVLAEWSRQSGRTVGRITDGEFVLEDRRRFPLDRVRFTTS
jgi:hypothetical protein